MSMIEDHPQRYRLANELHARPFPTVEAPAGAVYLAIKREENAAGRDRREDLLHLTRLLDHFGASHPKPDATHWFGDLGRYRLKWEQHTEFVTYTLFINQLEERPFSASAFEHFPAEWLATLPGHRITSALIRVQETTDEAEITGKLQDWFVAESLAVSHVLDAAAVIAGDFRIDSGGHLRFAVFVSPGTGARRIGRIVQRLCEIETYKTMSMLGFARAREISAQMGALDQRLSALTADMSGGLAGAEDTLGALLTTSAELEQLLAQSSFRFGATEAYEALVTARIDVLRETRFAGRQTFREFMTRRFDPAMRTVKSTQARLETMAARAIRTGDLLRTKVDVERSAQNQKLLESMNRRADAQLQLQKTVEGLSVVAISYYAVNLVINMLAPLAASVALSDLALTALVTPVVIFAVWVLVRRIRRAMER